MSAHCLRLLALAAALACAQAVPGEELGLKLQRSRIGPPRASAGPVPVFLSADRLEGITGKESVAEGAAELRKGNTAIYADWLKYTEASEDVEARGRVRIEREGDVVTGPSLRYRTSDSTGTFDQPDFTLAPRRRMNLQPVTGRGQAQSAVLEGDDKYRFVDGFFTTCAPGNEDWRVQASELDIDFARDVGTARNPTVYFKGVPILKAPFLDFSLNNQRKSGFLPPVFGSSSNNGLEAAAPYYFNLAPNRDLTLTPRFMSKRGAQLAGDFRFLEPRYFGELKAEVLPHDQILGQSRSAESLIATYAQPGRYAGLNVNRVSDDNYFRDLSSRINIAAQTTLPRDAFMTFAGGWWSGGSWNLTGRYQGFQVLQDAARDIPVPYSRAPQLSLNAAKLDLGAGLDFGVTGEVVDFRHPTSVTGVRSMAYPSLSLPVLSAGGFLVPKFGMHSTHYVLDPNGNAPSGAPGTPQIPAISGTLTRTLPIFSVDSGLIYERQQSWRGQNMTQTLEPRAYYLYVPYRDQNQIPLFDTAVADFNYAQIFSENSFVGGDRISDANQLTLAVTSRLLFPATGQEAVRATLGQRYYFKPQQVTINASTPPTGNRISDWLGAVSGRVTRNWMVDSALQYNSHDTRAERFTVGARYQPEPLKILNLSYRYLRDQIDQFDISGQWPLGRGWYGIGRMNYSIPDKRTVEGLAGFEYNGGCWIGRVVLQHYLVLSNTSSTTTTPGVVTAGTPKQAIFLQLELSGFSRIGSNPFEVLRRNIPGYARINQAVPVSRPYDFDD
jgi:LPS-assembly protein